MLRIRITCRLILDEFGVFDEGGDGVVGPGGGFKLGGL